MAASSAIVTAIRRSPPRTPTVDLEDTHVVGQARAYAQPELETSPGTQPLPGHFVVKSQAAAPGFR